MREASSAKRHLIPNGVGFQCPSVVESPTDTESIARQRTEVKLEFTGGFVPEVPDPDDHDDTVQARPLGLFIKSTHLVNANHPNLSRFPR